jgi:DNA polymerase elongation subunit (family B)
MNAKREAIASKGLWVSKKRYALLVHNSEGVEYDPPKLKIMGLDIVRSSTPHTIRAILKDSLKLMFEKSEKDLQKHITEVRGKFMQMPPEDIAFPRGVTDLEKWSLGSGRYKSGTPIHVRGSILYNSHYANKDIPPIANSDKIRFIYLKLPNPIKEDVLAVPAGISFPDAIKGYIDYDTQFEKTFLKPLEGLAVAAKWKLEEQSSLEDFFG